MNELQYVLDYLKARRDERGYAADPITLLVVVVVIVVLLVVLFRFMR